jgi:hypothetical protein
MPKYLEWDYDNPKHRQRRRRPPPILEGEILEPEPSPRIRVEVTHRTYQPRRQHSAIPPWLVALLIVAALMWWAPLGTIILIAIVSISIAAHPTIGVAIAIFVVLVVGIAWRQRRLGRPF